MGHVGYLESLNLFPGNDKIVEWACGFETYQELWDACGRGDLMLWILAHQKLAKGSNLHRQLVLLACKCARLAWEYMPKEAWHVGTDVGGANPRDAIRAAEEWATGNPAVYLGHVRATNGFRPPDVPSEPFSDCALAAYYANGVAVWGYQCPGQRIDSNDAQYARGAAAYVADAVAGHARSIRDAIAESAAAIKAAKAVAGREAAQAAKAAGHDGKGARAAAYAAAYAVYNADAEAATATEAAKAAAGQWTCRNALAECANIVRAQVPKVPPLPRRFWDGDEGE